MPARKKYDPLPLARRIVRATAELTRDRRPPAWVTLTAVCRHAGVAHDDKVDLSVLVA